MSDKRVDSRVEEILATGLPPEAACGDDAELLAKVRARLAAVRAVEGELDALFPGGGRAARTADAPRELPSLPGYEMQGVLGRGGMGVVFRARQVALNRSVAIKMMLAGAYASPSELRRFLREAEAVAKLRHPNIVAVHDAGEIDGRPYFSMELVENGTLAEKLAGRPQPIREAAELVVVLANAVHAAHEAGVVHRDLKPSNVLLAVDGSPKITDFGLARNLDGDPGLTVSGARLGTPSYMAPEQALGRSSASGAAVDVYALGAILYELLTGRPPFQGKSASEVERQLVAMDPVPPSMRRSGVPRDLDTICLTCLRKEPEQRYASAALLAADLGRFLRHEPIAARPLGRLGRAARWARRSPASAALALVLAVVGGLAATAFVTDRIRAAEQRVAAARWLEHVDQAYALLGSGQLDKAGAMVAQVSTDSTADVRARVDEFRRDLRLAERLDRIRMGRAEIIGGRFDPRANRQRAASEYAEAFASAGLVLPEDANAAAARVAASPLSRLLESALDDWALCEADPARKERLLDLARLADPDPSAWRDRARDPLVCGETDALAALAAQWLEDPEEGTSVALLVHIGERMHEAGADAAPFLRAVQRAHPADFWAALSLGEALYRSTPAEALRFYQAAVALRPESAIAHVNLGRTLATLENRAEATVEFREALRLDPGFARAHAFLGRMLQESGRLEGALHELELAVELEPDSEFSHYYLGGALAGLGRSREALQHFEEAVALAPENEVNRFAFAYHLTLERMYLRARAEYEIGFSLGPGRAVDRHSYGRVLAYLGEGERAIPELMAGLDDAGRDPVTFDVLRGLLLEVGRLEDARSVWERRLATQPPEHELWDGYAELNLLLGRTDEYRRACRALLVRFAASEDPQVWERIGRACLLDPTFEEARGDAIRLVERASSLEPPHVPEWVSPYFALAQALADHRGARHRQALELVRGPARGALRPAPQLVAALAHHALGETEEARATLVGALLQHDWSDARNSNREEWMCRILRREAEALLAPESVSPTEEQRALRRAFEHAALASSSRSAERFAAQARHSVEALRACPRLEHECEESYHYDAAVAASRAAVGEGADAAALGEDERADLRVLAIELLRANVAVWSAEADRADEDLRKTLAWKLDYWRTDPLLAVIRDAGPAVLPPAEREGREALWREVDALRGLLGGD